MSSLGDAPASDVRRFTLEPSGEHWGVTVAKHLLRLAPDEELYTCAAGTSPSGVVHFGNFRDVMTSWVVHQGLRSLGKNSRVIFSWDDFDRLRKVPAGVDPAWRQYIGLPLSAVPDPFGKEESYARAFQVDFEDAMSRLGLELEYRYQTKEYKSGRYDDQIIHSLRHRQQIAEILLSFMSEKGKHEKGIDDVKFRETFFPLSVYSEISGTDDTEVLDFDGERWVTYRCGKSGEERRFDLLTNRIAKLPWKVDWPMRWRMERVLFEPGGLDHATPGGSFDVASVVAPNIFDYTPPLFVEYKFVGIRGAGVKMSGSKGNAITPLELLKIYEPALLRWLYTRREPGQEFSLAFDSETIRQYDEFDREVVQARNGTLGGMRLEALSFACAEGTNDSLEQRVGEHKREFASDSQSQKAIPFRQAVGLGQILQWNLEKLIEINSSLEMGFTTESLHLRLPLAKQWLETYNPTEVIALLSKPNVEYWQVLPKEIQGQVGELFVYLAGHREAKVLELEELVYRIPKDLSLPQEQNKPRQRAFFKSIYNLLLGSDTGPRLSTFLWAVERDRVLELLALAA